MEGKVSKSRQSCESFKVGQIEPLSVLLGTERIE